MADSGRNRAADPGASNSRSASPQTVKKRAQQSPGPRPKYQSSAPGHCFRKVTLTKPTFCHSCSDFIWGIVGFLCEGKTPALWLNYQPHMAVLLPCSVQHTRCVGGDLWSHKQTASWTPPVRIISPCPFPSFLLFLSSPLPVSLLLLHFFPPPWFLVMLFLCPYYFSFPRHLSCSVTHDPALCLVTHWLSLISIHVSAAQSSRDLLCPVGMATGGWSWRSRCVCWCDSQHRHDHRHPRCELQDYVTRLL